MDLTPYADALHSELLGIARSVGAEAETLVERLAGPLDASLRLVVQQAVADAAQEISRELSPGSVDVRLRGRDLGFVVTQPGPEVQDAPPARPLPPEPPRDGDGGPVRLTVRLTEQLKAAAETAADAEGLSLNAYLVRVIGAAMQAGATPSTGRTQPDWGTFSGWVR